MKMRRVKAIHQTMGLCLCVIACNDNFHLSSLLDKHWLWFLLHTAILMAFYHSSCESEWLYCLFSVLRWVLMPICLCVCCRSCNVFACKIWGWLIKFRSQGEHICFCIKTAETVSAGYWNIAWCRISCRALKSIRLPSLETCSHKKKIQNKTKIFY